MSSVLYINRVIMTLVPQCVLLFFWSQSFGYSGSEGSYFQFYLVFLNMSSSSEFSVVLQNTQCAYKTKLSKSSEIAFFYLYGNCNWLVILTVIFWYRFKVPADFLVREKSCHICHCGQSMEKTWKQERAMGPIVHTVSVAK